MDWPKLLEPKPPLPFAFNWPLPPSLYHRPLSLYYCSESLSPFISPFKKNETAHGPVRNGGCGSGRHGHKSSQRAPLTGVYLRPGTLAAAVSTSIGPSPSLRFSIPISDCNTDLDHLVCARQLTVGMSGTQQQEERGGVKHLLCVSAKKSSVILPELRRALGFTPIMSGLKMSFPHNYMTHYDKQIHILP